MKRELYKIIFAASLIITATNNISAQTGTHVYGGAEMASFGVVDLSTPGGQTWSTDRAATPGYFSAIGTATYSGASDVANINGYVKYYVNSSAVTSFSYPVGSGADLRTLTLSGIFPANGVYATAWIMDDPSSMKDPTLPDSGSHSRDSLGSGIMTVSPAGMWDWQDVSGNSEGLVVSVSIPDVSQFSSVANLRLVGWNGTSWINLSSAQAENAASGITDNSTLTGTMVAGITAIAIGSTTDINLPVSLISFAAAREGNSALISWSTSEETNSDRFEIERSQNGKSWNKIGTVESGKESTMIRNYSFTDNSPENGKNLYRLKMVDQDETFAYSSIRFLKFDGSEAVYIYPNPAVEYVKLNGAVTDPVQRIEIVCADGSIAYQSATVSPDGIDVSKLTAGTYVFKIISRNGALNTQKLVIQR